MNLVQLQEQLKDLPMQAVQSYMNGANPQVPPYLAAAELQRRQSIIKSQQAKQGAAQGKQPSIKEQLEQASGLMGLQAQRTQQGIQQIAQQAQQAPMPATEGTPQPEPQPQPEVQMARGGIVNIPLRESMFRDGGVVGYAEGGAPMSPAPGALETLIKKREELRKLGMDTTKLDQQIAAMQGVQTPSAPEMTSKGIYPLVMQRTMTDLPEPTEEQQIESMRKLEEGAGTPEYLKRIQGLEEKYAKSTEGRGLENLIQGLSSAGAGRGAVGLAAAQAAARDRAADMEHAKEIAAAYGGLSKDRFSVLTQGLEGARKAAAQSRDVDTKTMGRVFGDVGEMERAQLSAQTQERVAQIYAGRSGAGGAGTGAGSAARLSLQERELARKLINGEIAAIKAEIAGYGKFPGKDQAAIIAQKQVRLDELQRDLAVLQGQASSAISGAGAKAQPGAQSGKSSATTDPLGIR